MYHKRRWYATGGMLTWYQNIREEISKLLGTDRDVARGARMRA